MNRAVVADLLGQVEDVAVGGLSDVRRGMPVNDVEALLADLQALVDRLHVEVRK